MASDDKKARTSPAPKKEAVPTEKSTPSAEPSKTEGGEKAAAAPKSYGRGEGQKPVTQAYKDNWNAIFANKKKKKR